MVCMCSMTFERLMLGSVTTLIRMTRSTFSFVMRVVSFILNYGNAMMSNGPSENRRPAADNVFLFGNVQLLITSAILFLPFIFLATRIIYLKKWKHEKYDWKFMEFLGLSTIYSLIGARTTYSITVNFCMAFLFCFWSRVSRNCRAWSDGPVHTAGCLMVGLRVPNNCHGEQDSDCGQQHLEQYAHSDCRHGYVLSRAAGVGDIPDFRCQIRLRHFWRYERFFQRMQMVCGDNSRFVMEEY